MKTLVAVLAILCLAACADLTALDEFAHADLQNAQKIASTPARAVVWSAVESQVTAVEAVVKAVEAQAKACAESLKLNPPTGTVGLATAIELASGAVNKSNADCRPIPLPKFLLPKL